MAVIEMPLSYLKKKTNMEEDAVIELLSMLGFPSEVEEDVAYVEVTPDRLDLLTYEGIIRAVNTYNSGETREYRAGIGGKIENRGVKQRPYIVGFTVNGIKDRDGFLEGIIIAQEKIHQTFGRKRKKIAIGIHDLDKVELPLEYVEKEDVSFVPLDWEEEASVHRILEEHEKGKLYGKLIHEPYPFVMDKKGVVSLPPIINADRTKLTEESSNFLVEITGNDKNALEDVARVLACSFIDRGGEVNIMEVDGKPSFSLDREEVAVDSRFVNKLLGMEFSEEEMEKLLRKSDIIYKDGKARTPCYRYDLFGEADIAEEVMINHGYDKIEGKELPLYQAGELNNEWMEERKAMLLSGFYETLGFFLINNDVQKRFFDGTVEVMDAVSKEHNGLRASVMLTLLSTEAINKMEKLPHKYFEIGRVYRDGKEWSELGFLLAGERADIDKAVGVAKRLAQQLGKEFKIIEKEKEFSPFFIEGRHISFEIGELVGELGEIKPEVNELYNINNALTACVMWKKEERQRG
ncbi:MAG: phenylalanine--tRNA ligase subunit beta [Methanobacteriota archaeon]|nr:MAG: phenylalanine--tRNA ligase subunit beta [Euryarchaeota archaeon]